MKVYFLVMNSKRCIRAFENVHEGYLMVADTIGVNKSTARSTVTRYVRDNEMEAQTCPSRQ